jgi:hypothetical protein
MRPCKILGPGRTKTFHVKHFGTIGPRNRTNHSADHHESLGEAARIGGVMRRAVA